MQTVYADVAFGHLTGSGPIAPSTGINVATDSANNFPVPTVGTEQFPAVIVPNTLGLPDLTNTERVMVLQNASGSWSLASPTQFTHNPGDLVIHVADAASLANVEFQQTLITSSTGPSGLTQPAGAYDLELVGGAGSGGGVAAGTSGANTGGGGATATNCRVRYISDGVTPIHVTVGAGGVGVAGGTLTTPVNGGGGSDTQVTLTLTAAASSPSGSTFIVSQAQASQIQNMLTNSRGIVVVTGTGITSAALVTSVNTTSGLVTLTAANGGAIGVLTASNYAMTTGSATIWAPGGGNGGVASGNSTTSGYGFGGMSAYPNFNEAAAPTWSPFVPPYPLVGFYIPGSGGFIQGPDANDGCAAGEYPVGGGVGGGAGGKAAQSLGGGCGSAGTVIGAGGQGYPPVSYTVSSPSSPSGGPYTFVVTLAQAIQISLLLGIYGTVYVTGAGITGSVVVAPGGINFTGNVITITTNGGTIATGGLTASAYVFSPTNSTTGMNGQNALSNSGCGGGGGGGNATGSSAVTGGNGGSGYVMSSRNGP